jgi:hypothetical protein
VRRAARVNEGGQALAHSDHYHVDPCISLWRGVIVRALLDALNIGMERGDQMSFRRATTEAAIAYLGSDGFVLDCELADLEPSYVATLFYVARKHKAKGQKTRWLSERIKNSIRRL